MPYGEDPHPEAAAVAARVALPQPKVTAAQTATADDTNPKDVLGLKKVPLRLIISPATIRWAMVMLLGGMKYGFWNWRKKKIRKSVYVEAIIRHAFQLAGGETVDPESGQPHDAHIMACAYIIGDARDHGCLVEDCDESPPMLKLMAELNEALTRGASKEAT